MLVDITPGLSTRSSPAEPSRPDVLDSRSRQEVRDQRRFRAALLFAIAFHTVLLSVTISTGSPVKIEPIPVDRLVFIVETPRFRPPPSARTSPPEKRVEKRIPIPDPTPDDPEPLDIEEAPEAAEIDLSDLSDLDDFGIPEGRDAFPSLERSDILHPGGEVSAPVKVFAPIPQYTEEARRARIMGIVLLQAVVERDGTVGQVRVVRELSFGLTESAVETVKSWKFRPAMRNGEPVAVYLDVTVSFSQQ